MSQDDTNYEVPAPSKLEMEMQRLKNLKLDNWKLWLLIILFVILIAYFGIQLALTVVAVVAWFIA